MKIIKKGFNYSQDGPGNRLVFHLQGCNMKCPWCANPESMPTDGVLMTDKQHLLDQVCPRGAIREGELDRAQCRSCSERVCLQEHRNKGIYLSYFTQDPASIAAEALEARTIFFDGGGVTFSGGEPTLQFGELQDVLKRLHGSGIHTVIETNGSHPDLPDLFSDIDLLIMDFKNADDARHREVTGISNKNVKANIRKALQSHPNVLLRTPLIHGFNDSEEHLGELLRFYSELSCGNAAFEFLEYHEYGREKWEQCGFTYVMKDGFVPEGTRERFEAAFKERGLKVVRT